MRRSKVVSAISLVAASALVLSACGGGDGDSNDGSTADVKSMAEGKAQQGDTYKIAEVPESDPVTVAIDEAFSAYNNKTADANSSYNNYILTATIIGPFTLDGNNKVLLNEDVMESVTVKSQDPQVVEWKMKDGVKWSDGAPWNCKDFYLNWLSHSGKAEGFNSSSSTGYELMDDPKCTDDLTFEATFTEPYLDYKGLFADQSLMPAHIIEQKTGISDIREVKPTDTENVKKVADFWAGEWKGFDAATMPGSGPYKIKSFDPNSGTVVLDKNPEWIGAKGGPREITVRAIPDTKAMATALQNGEIDVAASTQPDDTAADTMKGLSSQGVTYGSAAQLTFEHFDLNYNRLFKDEAARKAFFEVVDRQEITDKLLKGVLSDAKPLNSIVFFEGEDGFVDNYGERAGQGAEAAEKTLQEGGWTKGQDGIYQKDGERFSVTISHNENERRSRTVEIVQSQARAAGIEIKDETDPNFLKGRVDKGDYDIALFGWSAAPFKAEQKAIYITGGGQNWQGLSDPKIDQAFDTATSATDEAAATKAYQEADKALAEQYATLPIFATPSMWAFRNIDRVYMQSYNGVLWNVGEWERTG
ncbi:peptide ABC transporter substrate-binding protein [Prauserella marina]|uniref:Peptide/nickel transport system substrate-binding protein n=1 Tax=Prauserella marina TaxID=530584 RepID=A0A222VW45_9PSEU|nr:ABC transporter family substrate-binding protein [Prauserella marina]ASR37941.1 peptide ABC transporter substrate-binding protein [Prauserella marina]PWV73151.1 ABC-type transport system substrate-binding protein [Prauserella marina]SDD70650.1 peptide/nickel transport system substrate-binding protein [Prauserella marina]